MSAEEWDEATNLNCIFRSGPPGELDFVQAWHTATSQLRSVIFDHFVPWAARVIESGDVASLPEIPDPPADALPLAANEAGGILSRITGTADTVVAGTRIIFWAAAYMDPTAFRRAEDHRILFWRWTGKMLQAGGSVRVSEPVIDAIQAAFQRLLATPPGRQPAAPSLSRDSESNDETARRMTTQDPRPRRGNRSGATSAGAEDRCWYQHGPPDGTQKFRHEFEGEHPQKDLARWMKIDRKTFVKRATDGHIWVMKTAQGRFRIWFASSSEMATANMERLKEQRSRVRAAPGGNGTERDETGAS